jgi:hypothetical protein
MIIVLKDSGKSESFQVKYREHYIVSDLESGGVATIVWQHGDPE